ncbi:DUF6090 family protein [Psychroserpens burtonensis]|uniref:DUF6090 family protein n=1 Tax=Psychroserpens burtonensis TaxID=49278 RepID=UPI000412DCC8|nr:DUF6090 family protein [Psychroserpens burtonensis]
MIKFFRQTRYDLMNKNKTGKYLKYAIGETILVVVGILIALQINNWNENKKNRQQELIILENILQDLEKDKIGLNKIIERRISKVASAEIMISYYEGVKIDKLSDYYSHWTNVLYWEAHYPRNIAFKELVNSGSVSIIKNADIRNTLLDITASYEELFAVREHMYDDYGIYLYSHYSEIIDYGDGIKVWSNPNIKIELSEKDIAVALKSKAIKNGFTLASFNNVGLQEQLIQILNNVDLTIVWIKKEIEQ